MKNYYAEGGLFDSPIDPPEENQLNAYFQNMLNTTGTGMSGRRRRRNTPFGEWKWSESAIGINPYTMDYRFPNFSNEKFVKGPGLSLNVPIETSETDRNLAASKKNEGIMFESSIVPANDYKINDYLKFGAGNLGYPGVTVDALNAGNLIPEIEKSIQHLKDSQQGLEDYKQINPYNYQLNNQWQGGAYEPGEEGYDRVMRMEDAGFDFYGDDTGYFENAIRDQERLLKGAKRAEKWKNFPTLTAGVDGQWNMKQGGNERWNSKTYGNLTGQLSSQGLGADVGIGLRGETYFGRPYGGRYSGGEGMLGIRGEVGGGVQYNPFFGYPGGYGRAGLHGSLEYKPANWWPGYLTANAGLTGRIGQGAFFGLSNPKFTSVEEEQRNYVDPRDPSATHSYTRYNPILSDTSNAAYNWKNYVKPYFNIGAKFPITGDYYDSYLKRKKRNDLNRYSGTGKR
jgi:hypothetical protein